MIDDMLVVGDRRSGPRMALSLKGVKHLVTNVPNHPVVKHIVRLPQVKYFDVKDVWNWYCMDVMLEPYP